MVDDKEVTTTKVEKNGEFYTAFRRSESLVEKHIVFIVMRPDIQPKSLQQVYGETGEMLNGSFVYTFTHGNEQYTA